MKYIIDEAFIDLSFMDHEGKKNMEDKLDQEYLNGQGYQQVGIASTKTLSKVANHIAKKEKQELYI